MLPSHLESLQVHWIMRGSPVSLRGLCDLTLRFPRRPWSRHKVYVREYSNLPNTSPFGSAPSDAPSAAEIAPLLAEFASHPPMPLKLSTLLSFGRPLSEESVMQSVDYVLTEVPRLFGLRVRNLEALPFIVGMNPFIARILSAHRRAFQVLATFPAVKTLEENVQFTRQLEALVQAHANDIPLMAKG